MNMNEIKIKLSQALDENRFKHSLGVCEESVRMAQLFGADTDKAYAAGLLHDCAKCLQRSEQIRLCEEYITDEMTKKCPPVIHAPLGAVIAQTEYGITDMDILNAIRYHTVARSGMSLLEKIVYVADMTEPNRDFFGVEVLRELSKKNIDEAFREAVKQSLIHNLRCGNFIHPNTLEAWNDIIQGE